MGTDIIDHATFAQLAETGAVDTAHIVSRPGGWGILVRDGVTERTLLAERKKKIRIFRKLETLAAYLGSIGIMKFHVDATRWDNHQPRSTTEADDVEAATYDRWLRDEIQAAIDDPAPMIAHDEVAGNLRAAIKGARTKRAPA